MTEDYLALSAVPTCLPGVRVTRSVSIVSTVLPGGRVPTAYVHSWFTRHSVPSRSMSRDEFTA
jgi:hypothetical protein